MWRGWPRLSANTVAQNPAGSVRPALSGGHSAREAHGAHATAATIATAPRAAFSLSIEILEDDNLGAREEASHRRGLLAWARRRNPRAVSSSRPAPHRAQQGTLQPALRFQDGRWSTAGSNSVNLRTRPRVCLSGDAMKATVTLSLPERVYLRCLRVLGAW